MSELEARFVKQGLWTNYDQGTTMGKTITTDNRTGTVVIAILAVLASLGTAHLWHLVLFAYHQLRANGQPRDALFRQQQAILRTLPPPSTLFADSVRLWWEWRKRADSALTRSLIQTILALLCILGSLAASISSSYVLATSSIEVLVQSPLCGDIREWNDYTVQVNTVTDTYKHECYREGGSLPARCNSIFTTPNVKIETNRVKCPFSPEMCIGEDEDTNAVAVDSGLVDVGKTFGLNLPKADQVKFRRRTTCGILPLEGHTSVIPAEEYPSYYETRSFDFKGEELMLLHYGNYSGGSMGNWSHVTASRSLLRSNLTLDYGRWSRMTPLSQKYHEIAPVPMIEPLPSMKLTDADLFLIAVTKNTVRYNTPVDDPLFAAHKVMDQAKDVETNVTRYISDSPITMMGCGVQYQFCITDSDNKLACSDLTGIPYDASDIFPKARETQRATLQLLINKSFDFDLTLPPSLNASSYIRKPSGDSISQLPKDQWIIEVQNWESWVWAALQTVVTDYAIGPEVRAPLAQQYVSKPNSTGEQNLCHAQKMKKAGGFVNINLFGLIFTTTLSLTLVIFDLLLLKILIYLSRFRKALAPRIDRWVQDGVLQLQRRAYEAQGEGSWTNLDQDVPVTTGREKLSDLPLVSGQSPGAMYGLVQRGTFESQGDGGSLEEKKGGLRFESREYQDSSRSGSGSGGSSMLSTPKSGGVVAGYPNQGRDGEMEIQELRPNEGLGLEFRHPGTVTRQQTDDTLVGQVVEYKARLSACEEKV